jgi:hypothetical protein
MEHHHRGFGFLGVPIALAPSMTGHNSAPATNSGGNSAHSGNGISSGNTVSIRYVITAGAKAEEEEEEEEEAEAEAD